MNKIKIFLLTLIAAVFIAPQPSCTDGFEELNSNPAALPEVKPEQMLYTVEIQTLTSAHCWNAIYASKYRWLQYGSGIWGYSSVQFDYFMNSIGSSIYNEYNEMGGYVTNIHHIINKMPDSEKDRYSDLKQVSRIILIAKGIQTSDLWGSLAYSQGWKAREDKIDDESLAPEFETQEQLTSIWDKELKECIDNLKKNASSTNQVSLKGHDRSYNGDTKKWIKAANAIRLRLASRIWKQKPELAASMASEILAPNNAEYIFKGNDDSFIFWFDKLYTNIHSGDWHSVKDMEIASFCIMDYLNRNEDPRRRMYFVINNLTPENIKAFNDQQTDPTRLIPDNYTRWEGSTIIFDNLGKDRHRTRYFLNPGPNQIDMRPANTPQVRLWKGNDTDGNGGNWAPVITYPDFCFLAAEFVHRIKTPSSKTAKEWYEAGVKGSLDQWNSIGKFCDIKDYKAMTDEEIEKFLNKADVKWDESKALEQIYAQSYIEHYKNIDEAYALWKRTDYPSTTSSIIKFEQPSINGVNKTIPRRVKFSYPNEGVHNYENLKKRIDVMKADSQFGAIDNEHGRLWWDKK